MKLNRYVKIGFGLVSILVILACAQTEAPLPTPTQRSEASILQTLDAAVAGTSSAAKTQTETARPPTFTPTTTPTPTYTPTVTFTPTPTFVISPFTSTPAPLLVEATQTAIALDVIDLGDGIRITPIPEDEQTPNNQWRCIVRYSPRLVVSRRASFRAAWALTNTGWNYWAANTVDFVYLNGLRGKRRNIQDISGVVRYGGTLNIGDEFVAPNRVGTYKSHYALKVDATNTTVICRVKMIVNVEK